MNCCMEHSGVEAKLETLEKNDVAQWKSIDKMKGWVIAGCSSMIICLIAVIFQLIIAMNGR